jgi:DnaJ-class molecular chaperone
MDSHIIFTVTRDRKILRSVAKIPTGFQLDGSELDAKGIIGVGKPLPKGMFAGYYLRRLPDGTEAVYGVMQARAAGGRRYFYDQSESAAQTRLIKWSNRILREIAAEEAHLATVTERIAAVQAQCPQCNGSGYRNYAMFAYPPRNATPRDSIPCWTCNGSGQRA